MSSRRGSVTIERLPSARGPNSIRPWNQPTTSPAAMRSATVRKSASSSSSSDSRPARAERAPVLARPSTRARCTRDPSRSRAGGRASGSTRGTRRRPRCRCRRPRAGCRARRTRVSVRMRPFATALSATPPARQRFVEPVRRCASLTTCRYASSSTACSAPATSSWCFVSSPCGSRAGPNDLLEPRREDAPDRRRALAPRHVDALRVVREVVEVQLEEPVQAERGRASARGARPASPYGASPITLPSSPYFGKPSHCVTAV